LGLRGAFNIMGRFSARVFLLPYSIDCSNGFVVFSGRPFQAASKSGPLLMVVVYLPQLHLVDRILMFYYHHHNLDFT